MISCLLINRNMNLSKPKHELNCGQNLKIHFVVFEVFISFIVGGQQVASAANECWPV